MDDEEKRILQEANDLRRRELDLRQARIDKTFAIGRLGVLLWMGLATVTLGAIGLSQLDLPWGRAIFCTAACASTLALVSCMRAMDLPGHRPQEDKYPMAWGLLFLLCVLVAALTCPEAWW